MKTTFLIIKYIAIGFLGCIIISELIGDIDIAIPAICWGAFLSLDFFEKLGLFNEDENLLK